MTLWRELKRRNVFRVAAAYAVVAWLLVQAGDILLGNFGAPDWVFKTLAAVLLIGFPLALFLAWAYELTPEGVRRDSGDGGAPGVGMNRVDWLILIGLATVIGVTLADRLRAPPGDGGSVLATAPSTLPDSIDGIPPASGRRSIAVLPFANLSADPEQEFFADGITEDILTRLAGVEGLRVISRTSVVRFRGTNLSLPEIAAKLGVSHVLEGSVRRAGDRVRITGQLIDAASDEHLWAETWDRDLSDILAIQSEIAQRIADALEIRLTERDRRRLAEGGTEDVRAYELYLRALAKLGGTLPGPAAVLGAADGAVDLLEQAIAADPDFAQAHAGLSRALVFGIGFRPSAEQETLYEAALDAARRAVRLAPELAAGHLRMGHAYRLRGQGEAALAQFLLAAEIDPDDPETLDALAGIHFNQGRLREGLGLLEHAARVEPGQLARHRSLGYHYLQLGDLESAEATLRRAHEDLEPNPYLLACVLGHVEAHAGRDARALAYLEQFLHLTPTVPFAATCGVNLALKLRDWERAGEILRAQRELFESKFPLTAALVRTRLEADPEVNELLDAAERRLLEDMPREWGSDRSYQQARIQAVRGQSEQALALLVQAVEQGWRAYRELELDPAWDPLRDDPRFAQLSEQVAADLARMRADG